MKGFGECFTVVLNCKSQNRSILLGCLSSLLDIGDFPHRIVAVLNPYPKECDSLFDIQEFRQLDIIKNNAYIDINNIYNFIVTNGDTEYYIFIDDIVSFRDNNLFQIIFETHQKTKLNQIRFADRQSGISIKRPDIFDLSKKFYQIDPYLAKIIKKGYNN